MMCSDTVELDMGSLARKERKRAIYRAQSALEEHKILAKLRAEHWCVTIDNKGNWEAHKCKA